MVEVGKPGAAPGAPGRGLKSAEQIIVDKAVTAGKIPDELLDRQGNLQAETAQQIKIWDALFDNYFGAEKERKAEILLAKHLQGSKSKTFQKASLAMGPKEKGRPLRRLEGTVSEGHIHTDNDRINAILDSLASGESPTQSFRKIPWRRDTWLVVKGSLDDLLANPVPYMNGFLGMTGPSSKDGGAGIKRLVKALNTLANFKPQEA